LALRVAFVNSFRKEVRSAVHQALDLGEGQERGAVASIVVLSVERAEENHTQIPCLFFSFFLFLSCIHCF